MARSRFSDPIEPMTLSNMRENGVRSLAVLAGRIRRRTRCPGDGVADGAHRSPHAQNDADEPQRRGRPEQRHEMVVEQSDAVPVQNWPDLEFQERDAAGLTRYRRQRRAHRTRRVGGVDLRKSICRIGRLIRRN
jgi:hypothetical protein